jgi:hypothetical protein
MAGTGHDADIHHSLVLGPRPPVICEALKKSGGFKQPPSLFLTQSFVNGLAKPGMPGPTGVGNNLPTQIRHDDETLSSVRWIRITGNEAADF